MMVDVDDRQSPEAGKPRPRQISALEDDDGVGALRNRLADLDVGDAGEIRELDRGTIAVHDAGVGPDLPERPRQGERRSDGIAIRARVGGHNDAAVAQQGFADPAAGSGVGLDVRHGSRVLSSAVSPAAFSSMRAASCS